MSESDAQLAARIAAEAGRIALELRASGEYEGRALGDAGDRIANAHIVRTLREERPDDGLLSEESRDTLDRLGKSRVWIVDPVDGTREFSEGRGDWAVHIGLAIDGVATVGAVAQPELDGGTVFRTDRTVAFPRSHEPPRIIVSRSRPAAEAVAVAKAIGAELVPMGSAGAKAMAVVRGAAEIYLHSGGQHEWDNCAPVAVASAHGLHCSRIDGSPIRYNNRNTWMPDLLICRPEWAKRVLKAVSALPVKPSGF